MVKIYGLKVNAADDDLNGNWVVFPRAEIGFHQKISFSEIERVFRIRLRLKLKFQSALFALLQDVLRPSECLRIDRIHRYKLPALKAKPKVDIYFGNQLALIYFL